MFAISNFHLLSPVDTSESSKVVFCFISFQTFFFDIHAKMSFSYQLFEEKLDQYAFVQLILKIIIFYYNCLCSDTALHLHFVT